MYNSKRDGGNLYIIFHQQHFYSDLCKHFPRLTLEFSNLTRLYPNCIYKIYLYQNVCNIQKLISDENSVLHA